MKVTVLQAMLLSLVITAPSFTMDQNLDLLVRKSQAGAKAAGQALKSIAQSSSVKYATDFAMNNPVQAASLGLGAFAGLNAVRTWTTTSGTSVQKAQAVVSNPLVTVPAGVSLATVAANYTSLDSVTALVQKFPMQTVASWSRTVLKLLKDNPYYTTAAATIVGAVPAYRLLQAWNATAPAARSTNSASPDAAKSNMPSTKAAREFAERRKREAAADHARAEALQKAADDKAAADAERKAAEEATARQRAEEQRYQQEISSKREADERAAEAQRKAELQRQFAQTEQRRQNEIAAKAAAEAAQQAKLQQEAELQRQQAVKQQRQQAAAEARASATLSITNTSASSSAATTSKPKADSIASSSQSPKEFLAERNIVLVSPAEAKRIICEVGEVFNDVYGVFQNWRVESQSQDNLKLLISLKDTRNVPEDLLNSISAIFNKHISKERIKTARAASDEFENATRELRTLIKHYSDASGSYRSPEQIAEETARIAQEKERHSAELKKKSLEDDLARFNREATSAELAINQLGVNATVDSRTAAIEKLNMAKDKETITRLTLNNEKLDLDADQMTQIRARSRGIMQDLGITTQYITPSDLGLIIKAINDCKSDDELRSLSTIPADIAAAVRKAVDTSSINKLREKLDLIYRVKQYAEFCGYVTSTTPAEIASIASTPAPSAAVVSSAPATIVGAVTAAPVETPVVVTGPVQLNQLAVAEAKQAAATRVVRPAQTAQAARPASTASTTAPAVQPVTISFKANLASLLAKKGGGTPVTTPATDSAVAATASSADTAVSENNGQMTHATAERPSGPKGRKPQSREKRREQAEITKKQ